MPQHTLLVPEKVGFTAKLKRALVLMKETHRNTLPWEFVSSAARRCCMATYAVFALVVTFGKALVMLRSEGGATANIF